MPVKREFTNPGMHKDSIFVCILNENGILFQDKIGMLGVSNPSAN